VVLPGKKKIPQEENQRGNVDELWRGVVAVASTQPKNGC
jgi:hypothetical protein